MDMKRNRSKGGCTNPTNIPPSRASKPQTPTLPKRRIDRRMKRRADAQRREIEGATTPFNTIQARHRSIPRLTAAESHCSQGQVFDQYAQSLLFSYTVKSSVAFAIATISVAAIRA